jgi:uncharacterized protein YfaS (alpha-2-macroglobulin family)
MRDLELIPQGNQTFIRYEIRNQRVSPAALYDPNSVLITIYQPDGENVVDDDGMVRESTGVYRYDYQLAVDADTGIWTAKVKTVTGDATNVSTLEPCFTVTDGT